MIICPICKEKLEREEKSYRCSKNHSFDISKFGHSNLLLSNQKNSKIPGDNKEMVLSRKNFLERNYYKGISNAVNEVVLKYSKDIENLNILDIGCGEGYYTNLLRDSLISSGKNPAIVGIDISKEAVIAAARAYKGMDWIVASASNLPIEDESLDFIICMFAKIIPEEDMRTLKKGGKIIIVSTGENHLLEMKEVVYESVRKEFYSPIEDLKDFAYLETVNSSYGIEIKENESIINLFNMTPYRWRSPKDGIDRLFALDNLQMTVEVNIDIFEKK
ncbi:methyltransferase domain-containing protein [Cetobacterium sp. 2A]|uniref:putative RNA methyltransferase n=1 Tax=Cetobacterium sp. 2A TaxID=2754723 RepID=UPI00163C6637|nr:methyltransferase domain-containing protein [Cetobacterium sp. 2A]MBC2856048.1 methyltransferase domain-containing protein [Cetobacterium sp. 2A]